MKLNPPPASRAPRTPAQPPNPRQAPRRKHPAPSGRPTQNGCSIPSRCPAPNGCPAASERLAASECPAQSKCPVASAHISANAAPDGENEAMLAIGLAKETQGFRIHAMTAAFIPHSNHNRPRAELTSRPFCHSAACRRCGTWAPQTFTTCATSVAAMQHVGTTGAPVGAAFAASIAAVDARCKPLAAGAATAAASAGGLTPPGDRDASCSWARASCALRADGQSGRFCRGAGRASSW